MARYTRYQEANRPFTAISKFSYGSDFPEIYWFEKSCLDMAWVNRFIVATLTALRYSMRWSSAVNVGASRCDGRAFSYSGCALCTAPAVHCAGFYQSTLSRCAAFFRALLPITSKGAKSIASCANDAFASLSRRLCTRPRLAGRQWMTTSDGAFGEKVLPFLTEATQHVGGDIGALQVLITVAALARYCAIIFVGAAFPAAPFLAATSARCR